MVSTALLGVQCLTSTVSAQSAAHHFKYTNLPGQTHRQPAPDEAKSGEASFLANGGSISTYPNPASTRLIVTYVATKNGDLLLRLLNRNGRLVAPEVHVPVTSGEERKFHFDVSGLADGIYVLRAEQNATILFHRVLVAH